MESSWLFVSGLIGAKVPDRSLELFSQGTPQSVLNRRWSSEAALPIESLTPQMEDMALSQAQPILLDISSKLEQSVSIYNAFKDLRLNKKLDGAQHRVVESNLYIMKNSGVDLEAEKRHRFNEINQLLANLSTRFRNNVLDTTSGFSIVLTDKSSVEGLPEMSRQLLASAAVSGTGENPDPENGPWKVGLDLPSYEPVMMYSSNRKLREQLYRARAGRACSGQHDNIAVIEEIRKLSVLAGLFNLSSDLFGIKIRPADGAAEVWDDAVRFFNVYNEKESHIASFFLDPYSRPKEKQTGAWMDNFLSRSSLLHQLPVAFVVCNQIPPIGSTPSLMSFYEVSTLFHEFGHALQHMLSTVPYNGASGINNIEWDAVEFPSQFMSNWVYDRRTIAAISGHYQTGEPLPQAMLEKKIKARYYMKGTDMLTQLHLAALDLTLHSRFRDTVLSLGGGTSPLEVFRMFRGRNPSYTALLKSYGLA
ncbi:UNVERIFIED_CONTAM: hypothetical protein FKN15_038671 [Acipenser sinensis]